MAPIVASIKGRAKLGLQASRLFSKRIRRLSFRRGLSVFVEEVVEVEVVNGAVVVVSQIIVVKIEGVGDREDVVLKERSICVRGQRSVEDAAETIFRIVVRANSCESAAEAVQGRCSSD